MLLGCGVLKSGGSHKKGEKRKKKGKDASRRANNRAAEQQTEQQERAVWVTRDNNKNATQFYKKI
jgi:hypothetical protein